MPAMEIVAFWLICAAVWGFFHLTTTGQRRELVRSGWLVLFLTGAVGFAWELLH